MDSEQIRRRFASLATAHIADACMHASAPVRCAPAELQAIDRAARLSGRVLAAQHFGSVDVFLEAFADAAPGDVLVVDNGGRLDESCVGDLVVREAKTVGVVGIVIWGAHRDTTDLHAIGLPVFSLGSTPTGPARLDDRRGDALTAATVGDWTVDGTDLVFGDADGVLFVPAERADELLTLAEQIRDTEQLQARRIGEGIPLRAQLQFDSYLAARDRDQSITFRDHLRELGGALEA